MKMAEIKRDLNEDLATCIAATAGPWAEDSEEWPGNANLRYWVNTMMDGVACAASKEDARFIAEARTGWPHAIERALAAEAEVERLRSAARAILTRLEELSGTVDHPRRISPGDIVDEYSQLRRALILGEKTEN